MFSQIGSWQIQIDDFEVNLNPKDTISIPINSNINVSIDSENESLLVARSLADQLEKRVAFRRAMRQTAQRLQKAGVKGFKIQVTSV